MATNAFDIHSGMDVFTSDGQKIGAVGNIFSGTPGNTESDGTQFSDIGAGQPSAPAGTDYSGGGAGSGAMDIAGGTQVERLAVTSGQGSMNTGTETTGLAQGAPGAIGVSPEAADLGGGGTTTLTPSDTKYFEVKHGGFLGFGGDTLYVPFSAIASVAPGDNVTLACTAQQSGELYSQKPAPLQNET